MLNHQEISPDVIAIVELLEKFKKTKRQGPEIH